MKTANEGGIPARLVHAGAGQTHPGEMPQVRLPPLPSAGAFWQAGQSSNRVPLCEPSPSSWVEEWAGGLKTAPLRQKWV